VEVARRCVRPGLFDTARVVDEVEPLEAPLRVVVQSELVANEAGPRQADDPRAAAALESPLQSEDFFEHGARVVLTHSTKLSKLTLAAAMDHLVDGPEGTETFVESGPEVGRVTVASDLESGQRLRLIKFLAYGWSSQRSLAALRDQAVAAWAKRDTRAGKDC
jgi:alpha,alpha-trehalose phosphorylase